MFITSAAVSYAVGMKAKWRLLLLTAPLGVILALFQNCGQNTRQVHVNHEISTPGGLVTEKALDVLTFGTTRAHVDLSDTLSPGSELTVELIHYSEGGDSEATVTNKSQNLVTYPLSLEGMCPSASSFTEVPEGETPPITPGSGYLVRDRSNHRFAYLLFTGFTGEASQQGSNLNLIQMSFVLVTPKANVEFNQFLNDICGEPPLAMGPGLK